MELRPLLEIGTESDRLRSLASALAERGDDAVDAYVSASLRPFLLASLVEFPDGPGSGPVLIVAADDRSARDLGSDLRAFLAPRPVHVYPSRGTTYESHLDPPPHLAGLRIAALDALSTADLAKIEVPPKTNAKLALALAARDASHVVDGAATVDEQPQ